MSEQLPPNVSLASAIFSSEAATSLKSARDNAMAYTLAKNGSAPQAASVADPLLGMYGGMVVKKPLSTGGRTYPVNTLLSPEFCMSLKNRAALQNERIFFFHKKLTDEELAAARRKDNEALQSILD